MSLHKLTAGSGYDYLTRQVAALDATDKGHTGLASYYTEKGESPGVWVGSGMAGIDGLAAGDVVTAEQMQALFGSGHHPLAHERRERLAGPDLTDQDYRAVTRLGQPYKVYASDVSAYRLEVAKRIEALNEAKGLPADYPVPAEDRARVRTEVARELFIAEHGREPADARELAGTIAKHSRPKTTAVAGYDLTFSPVKSVSTLWAVADPATAARIEEAHQAAVKDALEFLERHALFTREGTNGVRQVDVRGLVANAFTHRDSRAGDPDLHTHVAVANKVQTLGGKWLAIDGRVLFKATVAASETYNTALERHLHRDLGVSFADREGADPRKRPVREIVGVDPALNQRWSARRASIEERRSDLATDFQRHHGRPPTPIEQVQLAQQATLETREAKHEPRTLDQQRASWREQAEDTLGGRGGVDSMVQAALRPSGRHQLLPDRAVDASEVARTVINELESRRSTWQFWHVRAETQRQIRASGPSPNIMNEVIDQVVADALSPELSTSLARPETDVVEPPQLRRQDGASVYTVAGAALFTSARILAAEQRLVDAAGLAGGRVVDQDAVSLALLEQTANGATLNAGQAALVADMTTSGARLQLAIAPAGAGKTTAMRALAGAWIEGGGHVLGLAPSAAAAAALRDQIQVSTDTLAKLTHSLAAGDLPEWAAQIGPECLVIIDEAGMADTPSLDAAVQYVLGKGGSVRLIGDDQQLAAIGAGGVLRDIQTTHGANRLTELVRFADPAEAAASLALRDGRTEALGFYLDHHRVHVGDLSTLTQDVFTAWQADRGNGLDSIMLAPTRDLVSQLNQRARAHRLAGTTDAAATPVVTLADGNQASIGELVITRANDRRLRVTASDWVKNGDRWTVLALTNNGGLQVQHTRHGHTVTLPAGYVTESVELGYATTVHAAQGVSVDTMHGLATGDQSRQQLYTMLTRGKHANHVYLQVAGDGDPHSVIRPEMNHPATPTDLLENILARDDAPRSATTLLREQADPATLLGQAAQRYHDALYVAAEDLLGPAKVAALDRQADKVWPGLTEQPAWSALRAHLLLTGCHGADPLVQLRAAAQARELDSAADTAAVLDWRLDDTGLRGTSAGPLPWVPGIPASLREHATWGPYLTGRAAKVTALSRQVHQNAAAAEDVPAWIARTSARPDPEALGDVAVWRAATLVDPADRRPTGPAQLQKAEATWQHRLNQRLTGGQLPAMDEWAGPIAKVAASAARDPFATVLAERLAAMARCGVDAPAVLRRAAAPGPLPDDHAAAALWWRINACLSPAVAERVGHDHALATAWTPQLPHLLGEHQAMQVQASPSWPSLVAAVDQALARGWTLHGLLGQGIHLDPGDDTCQALTWRVSLLLNPVPDEYDYADPDAATPDMWNELEVSADSPETVTFGPDPGVLSPVECLEPPFELEDTSPVRPNDHDSAAQQLQLAALVRDTLGPLEPSDTEINQMLDRAVEMDLSPVSPERIAAINAMTLSFYEACLPGSWGADHLTARFGTDLARDPRLHPGYAPAGWTHLVGHLRRRGVSKQEMLAAGVASTARTGRLIDRFRDRVVLPIVHHGEVLGFVGRRHPDRTDQDQAGPKYLNTPQTVLFHKGAQLYAAGYEFLAAGSRPVLVEGPMDAIAITLATNRQYVGVAPLGTTLTQEQARQLATLHESGATDTSPTDDAQAEYDPWLIVATDADLPGQVAAERDYWLLVQHGLDPGHTRFPDGHDPADTLTLCGPAVLRDALRHAAPLANALVEERLTNLPPDRAPAEAARVIAARPSRFWLNDAVAVASRLAVGTAITDQDLLLGAQAWNSDPAKTAAAQLDKVIDARTRMQRADQRPAHERWAPLARELDSRLLAAPDWPALATIMEQARHEGHDVANLSRQFVADRALDNTPAQDLRYRLVNATDVTAGSFKSAPSSPRPTGVVHQRRATAVDSTRHALLRRQNDRRSAP
ncbi:MobF family relaxase [Segeticoccus rhizosphaerae]|uniref:MobF family relaxase n=1 Tax=Segeticoccus rhizosphaerae TaxID=1104777 RepID=UPI0010C03E9F|nr:MobF family relaxase [Ornithinicoccus soli]